MLFMDQYFDTCTTRMFTTLVQNVPLLDWHVPVNFNNRKKTEIVKNNLIASIFQRDYLK